MTPTAERASDLSLLERRFDARAARGVTATYRIEITDATTARTRTRVVIGALALDACVTVRIAGGACAVLADTDGRAPHVPDVVLTCTLDTWRALVDGDLDGASAFLDGRLTVRGDLDLATRFETFFRRPHAVRRDHAVRTTHTQGLRIDALVAGEARGTPIVLLHGLAANKVSFLPTLDALAERHEVHALDLPGFGASAKPLPIGRRYSMAWFADVVAAYLAANALERPVLVGNSMGARIASEVALSRPGLVRGIAGLSPAVAYDAARRFAPLLRLTRPQWLGLAPMPLTAARAEAFVRELFADPDVLPRDNHRAAAEDVIAALADPAARLALAACARSIVSESARGPRDHWRRLEGLDVPSMWVFGGADRLVPARYAERVRAHVRDAHVEVWPDVGHVPQFERPARTVATLTGWMATVGA